MNNLSLLTYTHSRCANLHLPYFKRIEKYFPSLTNNFVTSNEVVNYGKCILYDDNETYSEQMINALYRIQTTYVIYSQEDYILFDLVDDKEISSLLEVMDLDKSISFIRLICSGVDNMNRPYSNKLYYIEPDSRYFFSTQITIWRKEVLIKMFRRSQTKSIFDEPLNSIFLKQINAIGLYTIEKGNRVGNHYNSLIYPYMATARVKGKWNFNEYSNELKNLFNEFNIKG